MPVSSSSPAPKAPPAANTSFDVVIIGGGPGGYVSAIRAAQLGLRTALVEGQHLGGICLNWGCIPTKSLLKSASLLTYAQHLPAFGIQVRDVHADIAAMVQRSRKIADTLAQGIKTLLRKNNVTVFQGWGCFQGRRQADGMHIIAVHPQPVTADSDAHSLCSTPCTTTKASGDASLHRMPLQLKTAHVVIATGARARTLFPVELGVWSAKQAMMPEKVPEKMLIVGAGAIGMEFASFYRALGVEVTVVEQADRILPAEDHEISHTAYQAFCQQGIIFALKNTVQSLTKDGKTGHYSALLQDLDHPNKPSALWWGDTVLVAVGVVGNTQGLDLHKYTDVVIQQDTIVTQGAGQTHEPGVYAIGDVTGPPWLAHKASHQGIACAEHIAYIMGKTLHPPHSLDSTRIPACTYTSPQIASVGLTERAAVAEGYTVKVGRFPLVANGQALALGDTTGMAKVIADATTGEVLGAHLVGQGVSEMIAAFAVARTLEGTLDDLKTVVFAHPTVSESLHEAVLDADGQALHFYRA